MAFADFKRFVAVKIRETQFSICRKAELQCISDMPILCGWNNLFNNGVSMPAILCKLFNKDRFFILQLKIIRDMLVMAAAADSKMRHRGMIRWDGFNNFDKFCKSVAFFFFKDSCFNCLIRGGQKAQKQLCHPAAG